MRATDEHALVPTLKRQLVDRQIDRREFVRYATLLGMAAPAAYAFAAKVTGAPLVAPAAAQGTLPKGGTLRIAMRCALIALTAPIALRSMHGICTRPPIGSQVRPRLCSMPISAAFST